MVFPEVKESEGYEVFATSLSITTHPLASEPCLQNHQI